jgi:hypothetical protein
MQGVGATQIGQTSDLTSEQKRLGIQNIGIDTQIPQNKIDEVLGIYGLKEQPQEESDELKQAIETKKMEIFQKAQSGQPLTDFEQRAYDRMLGAGVDPFESSFLRARGSGQARAQFDLGGIEAIAQDVADMFSGFHKISSELRGPLAGRTLGQLAKLGDPAVVTYMHTRELTLSNIAKKLGGEVGVLTDRDIERIKKALPALSDTQESAAAKMRFIYNYIDRRIKAKQKSAGVQETGFSLPKELYDPDFKEGEFNSTPLSLPNTSVLDSTIDKHLRGK